MAVRENFGTINSFEKTNTGVRMNFSKDGQQFSAEATLAVVAIGWMADTTGLNLAAAGVELNQRKFVKVDDYLRTSAPHIFAAGDIIGRMMLVPQALQGGFVAATNAVQGPKVRPLAREGGGSNWKFHRARICSGWPYRSKGPSNKRCNDRDELRTSTTRTIIDGRRLGFCKLVVDRQTAKILGCHVIGERAVDIAEVATIVIAAAMRVDELARIPLSYPTYAGILVNVAVQGSTRTWPPGSWQA